MKIEINLDFTKISDLFKNATKSKENIIVSLSTILVLIGFYRIFFL